MTANKIPSAHEQTTRHPAMTPQQAHLSTSNRAPLATYKAFAVGENAGPLDWFLYELFTLILAPLGGLLGFGARSLLYPVLFRSCAKKPAIGKGVTLRHPKNISLGKGVLIDDYAVLDVRGSDASITIGDHVSIGRFTTIVAKNGHLVLESGVNIGSYCRIATQSQLKIGESTLVGAYAYVGPGNHQAAEGENATPLISQGMEIKGGVVIGKHCWIGARATVLDGVTIGDAGIVGAHALVRDNVPAGATVVGTPARIVASK